MICIYFYLCPVLLEGSNTTQTYVTHIGPVATRPHANIFFTIGVDEILSDYKNCLVIKAFRLQKPFDHKGLLVTNAVRRAVSGRV